MFRTAEEVGDFRGMFIQPQLGDSERHGEVCVCGGGGAGSLMNCFPATQ